LLYFNINSNFKQFVNIFKNTYIFTFIFSKLAKNNTSLAF